MIIINDVKPLYSIELFCFRQNFHPWLGIINLSLLIAKVFVKTSDICKPRGGFGGCRWHKARDNKRGWIIFVERNTVRHVSRLSAVQRPSVEHMALNAGWKGRGSEGVTPCRASHRGLVERERNFTGTSFILPKFRRNDPSLSLFTSTIRRFHPTLLTNNNSGKIVNDEQINKFYVNHCDR